MFYHLPYLIDKISMPKGFFVNNAGIKIKLPNNVNFNSELDNLKIKSDIITSSLNDDETKTIKAHISDEFISDLIREIEINTNNGIYDLIKNYNVDISYFFLSKNSNIPHRRSQFWHHDSVGHRLKIFVDLGSLKPVPTLVEDKMFSHSFLNKPYMDDNARYLYETDCNTSEYYPDKNNFIVLNTNFYHKGTCSINSVRKYLCIELSHKLKSLCKGRVGKRKKP